MRLLELLDDLGFPSALRRPSLCMLVTLLTTVTAIGQVPDGRLTVQVDKPLHKVSPTFFGLMTEEINHAYDGGLYGELVQNGAFNDDPRLPVHWKIQDEGANEMKDALSLEKIDPNPVVSGTALRIDIDHGSGAVSNDGYWGVPLRPRTRYRLTFYARTDKPGLVSGQVHVGEWLPASQELTPAIADGSFTIEGTNWSKYSVGLTTTDGIATAGNRLIFTFHGPVSVWLAHVSLFGPTYHNRPNGNRIDLMEKLAELKPSFLRLPGGNYLEGNTVPERFEWKDTIGDPDKRPGHQGPWGYRSSDGLGLLEYLEWCEDLHMQPVLAVYAGYSLAQQHVDPGNDLKPYVDDALDEIEYVTGGTDTKWGAVRAQNGHPRPFPLTYVEIGNEDGFDRSRSYDGRFAQFYDAIKARYPQLQIIATAHVTSRKPDVIDDHYYRSAAEMERDSGHYDHLSRSGPKVFVGEWASTEGSPTPTFQAALGDAAWLTGLERDSDLVVMESYAPLLVNVNPGAAQWPTNLIGYDALTSFGSPSFYVQSMFARNTGDEELPVTVDMPPPAVPMAPPHGAVGIGTYRTQAEFKDLTVTSGGQTLLSASGGSGLEGWNPDAGTWSVDDHLFKQSSGRPNARMWTGDTSWTNYTISVKARKLGGAEGFLVLFHVHDRVNYWWWNVGGWNDTESAIQRTEDGSADVVGDGAPVTVQTGKWYDLRVEVSDGHVKGYLDGRLVNEATESSRPPVASIYASASRYPHGDVVLKVVNVSKEPKTLAIDLNGAGQVGSSASGWQMTGQPGDQNSIAAPTKVAPKAITVEGTGKSFTYAFPALSVTVLRLHAR